MDFPVDPDVAINDQPLPSARVPPPLIPQAPAGPQPQQPAAPWQDYQTVFTNAKAGMESVDKGYVQKIVYEMSKDSAHFRNEQRKAAQLATRISQLKARSAAITPAELAAATRAVDQRISSLECRRDLSRTWLHADMDCFYAAVHEAERPELKRLPVAVGGMDMISTANYVARKYGVRSAMPGFIGKRLCPQLVFISPDFKRYTAAAEHVRQVFRQLDPDFESGGLDEAYLDITDYCTRRGCTGEEAAEELRNRVRESCGGLTCSCGVAPNKMLAKICSDINKPDGQYVLPPRRAVILSFLDTLPTRKIPCIGKVTEQLLAGVLGITTCGGLLGPMRGRLQLLFSETATAFFMEAALGLAATRHAPKIDPSQEPGRKGISCERTFRNMKEPREQEDMARQLVESLAADMAAEQLEGRNLTLKLKLSTFEVRTRAATMPRYVRTASDMLPTVLRLLRAEGPLELRLMGVRMAALRKVNAAVSSPLARLLGLKQLKPASGTNTSGNDKSDKSDQHNEMKNNDGTDSHKVLDAEAVEVAAPPAAAAAAAAAAVEAPPSGSPHRQQQQPQRHADFAPPSCVITAAAADHTFTSMYGTREAPSPASAAAAAKGAAGTAGTNMRMMEPGKSSLGRRCRTAGGGSSDGDGDAATTDNAGAATHNAVESYDMYGDRGLGGLNDIPLVDLADSEEEEEEEEEEELPGDLDLHLDLDPDPDLWPGDGDGQGYDHFGHCGDRNPRADPAAPFVPISCGPNLRHHSHEQPHQHNEDGITTGDFGADSANAAAMTTTVEAAAAPPPPPPAKRPRTDNNNADDVALSSPSTSSSSSLDATAAAADAAVAVAGGTAAYGGADGGCAHHHHQGRQKLQGSSEDGDGGDRHCHSRLYTSSTHAAAPFRTCTSTTTTSAAAAAAAAMSPRKCAAAAAALAASAATATAGPAEVAGLECEAAARRGGGVDGSGSGMCGGGSTSALWTCRVCTYAHNRRQLLRCEVCDCLRTSTQPLPPPPPPPPQPLTALRQKEQQQQQRPHTHNQHLQQQPQPQQQKPHPRHRTQPQGRPPHPSSYPSAHLPLGQRPLEELWAAAAAAASANRPSIISYPPSPGLKLCPQCGAAVATVRWGEHQDWHLALRLSREGDSG